MNIVIKVLRTVVTAFFIVCISVVITLLAAWAWLAEFWRVYGYPFMQKMLSLYGKCMDILTKE